MVDIAMEDESVNIDAITENGSIFKLFAARADTPRGVTVNHLSKLWSIPLDTAKSVLDVTSQLNRQSVDISL